MGQHLRAPLPVSPSLFPASALPRLTVFEGDTIIMLAHADSQKCHQLWCHDPPAAAAMKDHCAGCLDDIRELHLELDANGGSLTVAIHKWQKKQCVACLLEGVSPPSIVSAAKCTVKPDGHVLDAWECKPLKWILGFIENDAEDAKECTSTNAWSDDCLHFKELIHEQGHACIIGKNLKLVCLQNRKWNCDLAGVTSAVWTILTLLKPQLPRTWY